MDNLLLLLRQRRKIKMHFKCGAKEEKKFNWMKEENKRLWECYLRINERKEVIGRECMGSGSRRE